MGTMCASIRRNNGCVTSQTKYSPVEHSRHMREPNITRRSMFPCCGIYYTFKCQATYTRMFWPKYVYSMQLCIGILTSRQQSIAFGFALMPIFRRVGLNHVQNTFT